jgi:hypothetical protein
MALRLNQRPRKTLGFQTPASKPRASVAPTVWTRTRNRTFEALVRYLSGRLFGGKNLPLLGENQFIVEPQLASLVRFLDDPDAVAGGMFAEGTIALMQQVANLLLVGSHKNRIADGCRGQIYLGAFPGVLTVRGGRGCAWGAEPAAPQLHPVRCEGRDIITVRAAAGFVHVGIVC